ncbi:MULTISPECIES: hypothetical protein [Trichocoleus]|uniref:Uncharacterized protein n=1 Tax=Trichocoleus desertorum GB2-A4 TaxID=2933944 RepID=A0ABV0JDA7_9CYAN|nr:hypothetical protein [Trichocoleus sp. FACHB-46]MBD1863250.1 hypothetical protein [Trichocoleus sp. FACHB-46]
MFGKKKSQPEQPTQSQSIDGANVVGSQVQMTQSGRDATANQAGNLAAQQQGLTGGDVVKLLEELETTVKAAKLPADQEEEALDYLKSAKREAKREDADKDTVAKNLKRVGDALETADKATQVWDKAQEVFKNIAPWLGGAAKFLSF